MSINYVTRLPGNQHRYDVFWSGDPAFIQGTDAEHTRKLEIARETGDWSALLIQGLVPTKFVCRQIPGELKRRIMDRFSAGKIGGQELDALLVRLAVVDVVNLGDFKLGFAADDDWGRLATHALPDVLDEHAPGAVADLAVQIFNRMMGLAGK
jgi:hypothetical protein